MSTQLYIWCAISGLLGMCAYVFIIKIPAAIAKAKAANVTFGMKDYLSTEYPTLIGNLLSIAIALLVLGEVLTYKPELRAWIIAIFAFYGFTGSSILLAIFGQINKKLNSIIDVKTNVADAVTDQPVTSINGTTK